MSCMDEICVITIPYANDYINLVRKEVELKNINSLFNEVYGEFVLPKSYKVSFNEEITIMCYERNSDQ